ncbi:MAG: integrase core domain-containing protein [Candidatus Thiodiazotropha endolucinida]
MSIITRCFSPLYRLKTRLVAWLQGLVQRFLPAQSPPYYGRRNPPPDTANVRRLLNTPKPPWVRRELICMKAWMPDEGCRPLAAAFNRRFRTTRQMTVGKTYVAETLKRHAYEVRVVRTGLKRRPPRPVPLQRVWGLDLTGKTDHQGNTHTLLGIVEHASRANLTLTALADKTALTLLEQFIRAIRRYGKPVVIRTDNEPVFRAKLFQIALWLLDIRHQTTDPGCPWMNGRIERFFGTLKGKLNRWEVDSREQLEAALGLFRVWYNHVRPHQHLNGRTPAEVWAGIDCFTTSPKQCHHFEAWDGLLTGYYLRY